MCEELDGMVQMRQRCDADVDKFRVTFEMSQLIHNVFKLDEKPMVTHGRPVLVMPGAHGRLSNIDAEGKFINDEVFQLKTKTVVRKKGESAGALMKSWRQLRDSGDEKVKGYLNEVEVMQQPAGFCDSVIVSWICEMRTREGYAQMIVLRDMFAGGLSASVQRVSVLCNQLRSYIAGKMTAVMQLTDVCCAFSLKQMIQVVKESGPERRHLHPLPA